MSETNDDRQICKVCGKVNSAKSVVCSDCGNSLRNPSNSTINKELEPFEIDGVSDTIIRKMVKSTYYLQKFRKLSESNSKISFNPSAMFGSLWLFARKMYIQAILLSLAVSLIVSIVSVIGNIEVKIAKTQFQNTEKAIGATEDKDAVQKYWDFCDANNLPIDIAPSQITDQKLRVQAEPLYENEQKEFAAQHAAQNKLDNTYILWAFIQLATELLALFAFSLLANYFYMKFIVKKAKEIISKTADDQATMNAAESWMGSKVGNVILGYVLMAVLQFGLLIIMLLASAV